MVERVVRRWQISREQSNLDVQVAAVERRAEAETSLRRRNEALQHIVKKFMIRRKDCVVLSIDGPCVSVPA